MKKRISTLIVWLACLVTPLSAFSQEASEPSEDETAIRKIVESYVETFNRRDAAALAAFWSPDAVYTIRSTGEQVVGRDAIQQQFAAQFEDDMESKLSASVRAVQFISPNVAVEHGSARLDSADESPMETNYTAVYVKRDGNWLLDRVTEDEVVAVPSHYEQLKELEWMVGTWVDQDEEARIETECQWTRNNNFLTRSFTVSVEDHVDMAGMQIIGWDPAAKQIRSWVFDSDGGFSEDTWSRKGDRWFIRKKGVLPDGRKSSAVHIIRYVDENTCTLQAVARAVDGDILPNLDEVTIVRKTQ